MNQTSREFFARLHARRLYWGLLLVWAVAAYFVGGFVSEDMKFRINNLSGIPGAGMVMRNIEGEYFHVNDLGQARLIYPTLAEGYSGRCLDCVLVTGEKLAATSDFCAAGVKRSLPAVSFEVPCRSWAVIDDGAKVVSVTLFLIPVLLWPMLRAIMKVMTGDKPRI